MRKMASSQLRWALTLLAALAFAALPALAQTTGGSIQGQVLDQAGQPVIGAVVHVSGPSLQGTQGTTTDTSGQYMIPYLPPGKDYKVEVEAGGYNRVIRSGITVPLGATVNLPFALSQGTTEITVTAAAPTIDIKSTATGVTLSNTMIESIPLQRDSQQIAYLAPTAVDAGPSTPHNASIGGSTGAENNYLINGVDVTDTGYGTNGSVLNFDFIQEMQILTGGLPPEYGASTGGVINAITRSGGNEFHGSLYGYYWSDKTQAKSVTYSYAPNITGNEGYKRYDVGGDVGGFIIKDKLWFYVAYDYNRFQEYTLIPSGPGYGDQFLYLNGAPAQSVYAGQRITDDNEINPMYALKLTWNLSPDQKISFTAFGNDRRESLIGGVNGTGLATLSPLTAAYEEKESPYNLSLQWNATWNPKFFSEVSLNYRHRKQDFSVNSTAASNWSYSYLFSTGVYGGFQALPMNQTVAPVSTVGTRIDLGSNYQASLGAGGIGGVPKDDSQQARIKFTNLVGKHELSYGFQYQENKYDPNINLLSGPTDFVSPLNHETAIGSLFVQWAPASMLGLPDGPGGQKYVYYAQDYFTQGERPSTQDYDSLWINDNWSLTQYFTLKLGLRWEEEKLTGDLTGNSIKLRNNYAPRIGFTWDVAHNGKSKFYGFAGRYFERVPSDIAIRGLNSEVSGFEGFYDPQLTVWTGDSQIYGAAEYIQGQDMNLPVRSELKAPYTDEYILGYDYQVTPDLTIGARGIYRTLGRTIDDLSYDGANTYVIGNPDQWTKIPVPSLLQPNGTVFFPKPVRIYRALELTADKRFSNHWQMGGSYVLSRLEGNYEGASSNDTIVGQLDPNLNATYDLPDFLVNGYGMLPLDRTHQVKLYGSYAFTKIPLELSGNFSLQSGTPVSRQIQVAWYGGAVGFAQPRGANGRTPTTWALDLGAQYTFKLPMKSDLGLRLDIFNVTNEQRAIAVYQTWQEQATFAGPILMNNTLWGKPFLHQTPRLMRFALRWTF